MWRNYHAKFTQLKTKNLKLSYVGFIQSSVGLILSWKELNSLFFTLHLISYGCIIPTWSSCVIRSVLIEWSLSWRAQFQENCESCGNASPTSTGRARASPGMQGRRRWVEGEKMHLLSHFLYRATRIIWHCWALENMSYIQGPCIAIAISYCAFC